MSRIAIAVMCADNDLSRRNMQVIKDTYVKDALASEVNEYKIFFYWGDKNASHSITEISDNVYEIICDCEDGIHWTYEKTIMMMRDLSEVWDYDFLVRCNISTYFNVKLFDRIHESVKKDIIYCSAMNSIIGEPINMILYPRGDFYIMSKEYVDGVVSVSDEFMDPRNHPYDHVDDVIVGACIRKFLGGDYYKHLVSLKYGYFPYVDIHIDPINGLGCLSYRLKTVPEGYYSGWSWGDNEYRKRDVDKFRLISDNIDKLNELCPTLLDIKQISLNDENGESPLAEYQRPIVFLQANQMSVKDYYKFLNKNTKKAEN